MGFTFAARTLLELGKELISTDEVALYELLKNGVDAQQDVDFSERNVTIKANIVLLRSDYTNALEALKEGKDPVEVLEDIEDRIIDGADQESVERLLQSLRDSVDDRRAFKEALSEGYAEENWIEVSDHGHGMSLDDLNDIFLRVGTRSRRSENVAGATYLGDKGVGRLSAMRLGDILRVKTSRRGETHFNLLDIPWSLFSHDSDLSAEDVEIEPEPGRRKKNPEWSGTKIRILSLSADWSRARFEQMLQGRIARMVDPFQPGRANRLINAHYNDDLVLVPSIPRELLNSAHATLKVNFRFEDGEPVLDGLIDYRLVHRQRRIDVRGAEIYSLAQETAKRRGKKGHAAIKLIAIRPSALEKLGPFSCEMYWFNRRVVAGVQGLSSTMAETKLKIADWSGGPMLYRYDFRVLPYGDPDDDWLALDQNAFGESGFKLNRQQVIGRVSITSPHTAMSEQTNREGLIQSEASDALKKIMMWLVHMEMRDLINEADYIEKLERRQADEDATQLRVKREQVDRTLDELRLAVGVKHAPMIGRLSRNVADLTTHASSLVSRLDKVVNEAEDEREKFVYLAGIGLMTEFIFHELERAVTHTLSVLTRAQRGNEAAVLESLAEQLKTLHKRIAAFDEMTGEKRQSKSNFDMRDLIDNVLASHNNEFDRHSVIVEFDRPNKPIMVRAVRGMVIQILENLLTNALYWLKQQHAYEEDFQPRLWVSLDVQTRTLSVEDNGPGVTPDRSERIFQPFVTSKPVGQGRGLGLYISRELATYHKWKLGMDPTIGRQRRGRTNMFILEMS